jgi:protein-L-isoaspartate(D-aspartate) O-methyltransferase
LHGSGVLVSIRFSFPPDPYVDERDRMVRQQIERRGLRDRRVLETMRAVPRHRFLTEENRSYAYDDTPLPIGCRQTISQPYIVAYMTEALELQGEETVLEIGTGSGYQTAVLACLSRFVYSVERIAELAARARENLSALGIDNAEVVVADGTGGLPEHAPYQAILVTAGTPVVPGPLLNQLADGGRLLAPVGGRSVQDLILWQRTGSEFTQRRLIPVVFVPLIGKHGWDGE